MKRLTVRELNALTSIIQDELRVHNDKKINPKKFNAYVDAIVETQTEHLMLPYNKLLDKQEKLRLEVIEMESLIKSTFDLPNIYGVINKSKFVKLKQEARKQVIKQYKLINVPDPFEVEKLVYKSGSEDFKEIIKSIVNQLSRKT